MPKAYRTREGSVTAVSTKTQLTTVGSETAPGPLLVPAAAKNIAAVITAFGSDCSVAADGAYFVRLEGPGLPEGPEVITIGASGCGVATGGCYAMPAQRLSLSIPVTPSNEILVFAENSGEDTGTTTVGVTLEFEM